MKNTIVIFGKGNVGKSTLLGYLFSLTLNKYVFEKKIEETKKKFGSFFEHIERYSYLVSNPNERKSYSDDNAGNTKEVHFHPYGEFFLIDTPGNEHAKAQKDLGMFLGDIGIYVIDAPKLLKEINFGDFSQLFLWNTLKGKDKLIVVISKTDLVSLEELKVVYEKADRIFNQEAKLNVKIIPITIDRNNDEFIDKNITKPYNYNFCPQYNLKEVLDDMLQINTTTEVQNNFCVYAERYFDHSHKNGAGVGRTWRNRILSGNIQLGANVKILPIKYNKCYTEATAKIKSIKAIDDENKSFANEGEIIGLDFSDIRISGKRVDKDKVVSTRGTVIVDSCTVVNEGNAFIFKVPSDAIDNKLLNINLLEDVYMYWFGKRVLVKLLKKELVNDEYILILFCQNSYMVMPIIKQKFLYDTITLEIIRNLTETDNIYFNATLINIGFINNISITENIKSETVIGLSGIENHIINKKCYFEYEETNKLRISLPSRELDLYNIIKDLYCAIENENFDVEVKFNVENSEK